ncbi:MAG: hypothetical protein KGD65_08990 [Candidatus Lokiarchaeota archaeon]|nr:hypothetical protein [Candidatus Lokiarchaeota archaeon]
MDTILNYSDLIDNLEKKVKIVGKISKIMWQHLTIYVDSHPFMNYFDLNDGHQIIVYTKEQISCKEKMEVIGKIIKIESQHKNPRVKISDKFSEYHLITDSWKCLD